MSSVLEATGLTHSYRSFGVGLRRERTALNNVTLSVAAGESVGLVGSSGAGKSTLLRFLLALEKPESGTVAFDSVPVVPGPANSLRWYRRQVQYVPQNPAGSLDPRMNVEHLLLEPLKQLQIQGDHTSIIRRALERVELDPGLLGRRPAELSIGQNQRVAIARALIPAPRFLLADEAVSGLDLPLRNTILEVLDQLIKRDGMGLLFVSHDLAAVAGLCSRTVVLAEGRIVETGATADLFSAPRHPVTQELIASIPRLSRTGRAPSALTQ